MARDPAEALVFSDWSERLGGLGAVGLLRSRPFDTDMRAVVTRSVYLVDQGEREVTVGDAAGHVDVGNGVPACAAPARSKSPAGLSCLAHGDLARRHGPRVRGIGFQTAAGRRPPAAKQSVTCGVGW